MQGKCYYCGKELTERTIKRHIKNCSEMLKVIEEEKGKNAETRKQFIISIKDKYSNEYCIYVSIDANLQLNNLDDFIRDVWVECCGHLSMFKIKDNTFLNNMDEGNEMQASLKNVINNGCKFEYQYDFGDTTYLVLEVIEEIEVSIDHCQIEILARNNPVITSNGEYLNSPRDGVCGYYGEEEFEKQYRPFNKNNEIGIQN